MKINYKEAYKRDYSFFMLLMLEMGAYEARRVLNQVQEPQLNKSNKGL